MPHKAPGCGSAEDAIDAYNTRFEATLAIALPHTDHLDKVWADGARPRISKAT